MSSANLPPRPSEPSANLADQLAQEVDVQTALALSRAATRAMRSLSPYARHAVDDAIVAEIELQNLRDNVSSQIVAALLRQEIAELA